MRKSTNLRNLNLKKIRVLLCFFIFYCIFAKSMMIFCLPAFSTTEVSDISEMAKHQSTYCCPKSHEQLQIQVVHHQ